MKGVHKMGLAGSGPENWTYVQLYANLSCNIHVGFVLVLLNNPRNTKKHKGRYLKYAPNMHPLNVIFYLFYSLQQVSFSSSVELPFSVSLPCLESSLHSALCAVREEIYGIQSKRLLALPWVWKSMSLPLCLTSLQTNWKNVIISYYC